MGEVRMGAEVVAAKFSRFPKNGQFFFAQMPLLDFTEWFTNFQLICSFRFIVHLPAMQLPHSYNIA